MTIKLADRWKKAGPGLTCASAVFAAALVLTTDGAGNPVFPLGHFFFCPFKMLTGYDCPLCGMTRSFVHLAHRDMAAAFAANPAGLVLFFAMLVYLAAGWGYLATGHKIAEKVITLKAFAPLTLVVLTVWGVRLIIKIL